MLNTLSWYCSLVKKDVGLLDAFGKGASDDIQRAKTELYSQMTFNPATNSSLNSDAQNATPPLSPRHGKALKKWLPGPLLNSVQTPKDKLATDHNFNGIVRASVPVSMAPNQGCWALQIMSWLICKTSATEFAAFSADGLQPKVGRNRRILAIKQ